MNALAPASGSTPLGVPDWWPAALSVPEQGALTEVNREACTLNFLVPVSDALVQGGSMEERARAKGLKVRLLSSDTTSRTVLPGDARDSGTTGATGSGGADGFGFVEQGGVAEEVLTHVVVFRIQRDALAKVAKGQGPSRTKTKAGKTSDADRRAVDATLTLTSRGDGVVSGEYALAGSCGP